MKFSRDERERESGRDSRPKVIIIYIIIIIIIIIIMIIIIRAGRLEPIPSSKIPQIAVN